ncbi:hypothetical protein HK105_206986 [Polyrhizophydium stewartii]|uniref:chitin synthase n=1 Tax=Polyrhizophydium stewartii TaxID=2732419 RepID=A0ABR4N1X6_9FUNG
MHALAALWAALAATAAAQSTGANGKNFVAPSLPTEDWLETQKLLMALDPNPPPLETADCYLDICGSYSGFIDAVMQRCNATITGLNPNYRPTLDTVTKSLEDCLCGKDDAEFDVIVAAWQNCADCMASGIDPSHGTTLTRLAYGDACSCTDPGPLEALANMGNSNFKCNKKRRRGLVTRYRGQNPFPFLQGHDDPQFHPQQQQPMHPQQQQQYYPQHPAGQPYHDAYGQPGLFSNPQPQQSLLFEAQTGGYFDTINRTSSTTSSFVPQPMPFATLHPPAERDAYPAAAADEEEAGMPPSNPAATMRRRIKTVKLSSTGNFAVKQRVPKEVLTNAVYVKGEEFETMRYTAVACDPDSYVSRGYDIRASRYNRPIEIFIVVTMYNEDHTAFLRTMFALVKNLKYMCTKGKYEWDTDGWKKVVVCIVSDGRAKVHPAVLNVLEGLGVYQEGIAQASVNGEETHAHVYEYTTQIAIDEKLNVWTAKEGIPPMQIIFCLKEKNAKKINSHRWFFNAFCPLVDPRVCMLIDVGTRPDEKSIYRLWKAFYRNSQIAGACGEIRADLGEGFTYVSNLLNPIVASQNFEYKISNLLDKSLESVFGYISVLPGAFSAYRYEALQDSGLGTGPLARYFEGEMREGVHRDNSIFSANLYLAEDRILCFELVAKRGARWTLHYVSRAFADTDVPDTIPEFLSQRRRWLNGSLFAGFYALSNIGRFWMTRHNILRKLVFTFQFIYNVINQIFTWFIIGNFAVTFYYFLQELELIIGDPSNTIDKMSLGAKTINVVMNIIRFSYPVVLVCLFIISFGNRPQAYRRLYATLMIGFGFIGAGMLAILLHRTYVLSRQQFISRTPDAEFRTFFSAFDTMAGYRTNDSAQLLVNTMIMQTNRVFQKHLLDMLAASRTEAILFAVAFASTFGVFFIASLLQLDMAHMFTSFLQYLLLLPSYINVLTVYALANLHDVSWGTKGDSKAEMLPALQAKTQKDGTVVADVSIAVDRKDISTHYQWALKSLAHSAAEQDKKPVVDAKTKQEDDYKGFRTALMLWYIATNAILFGVATTVGTKLYILIILASISVLSGIKLLGVVIFVIMRLATEVFSCFDSRGKWRRGVQVATGEPGMPWKAKPWSKKPVDDYEIHMDAGASDTASILTAD